MNLKLVAVTACVSGVAHTYMAAQRLEKLCQHEKWLIKVETQGALGIENALNDQDITTADVALLITDIDISGYARFKKSRLIHTGISTFLLTPNKLIHAVKQIVRLPAITQIKII